MTQITVRVDGNEVKSVVQRATLAVERLPQKVIKKEIEAARDEARKYPPELPWQRYRRTFRYRDSFKIESIGRGYRLVSDARARGGRRYTVYVGGSAEGTGQAGAHRGRWPLIYHAIRAATDRIVEKANEYFRAVFERNGAP